MFITISKSGNKTEVIEYLRAQGNASKTEIAIASAIADHLDTAAAPETEIDVSATIALRYGEKIDNDGNAVTDQGGSPGGS